MKKIMLVFLVLVMSLNFGGYTAVAAPADELLPPGIMPVVILKGSDYEMGYQYGQQLGHYIEMNKNAMWASALRSSSRDDVLKALKIAQSYTKEYAPEAIEMYKGIADGATAAGYEMSYTDVLLINSGVQRVETPTPTILPGTEDEKIPPEGCSIFSLWGSTTTDGKLICGNSHDSRTTFCVAIIAFPDNGNSYITTANPGELARFPIMNNKGVFIGSASGLARRPVDSDYGIPRPPAYQHLARFANSATEAKDMFLPWKYACSRSGGVSWGWNVHFSDVKGNAFVVETTGALKTVRKPGDFDEIDFLYNTNNFFTKEMQEAGTGKLDENEKRVEHAGWRGTMDFVQNNWGAVARNLELWNMLHNYHGKIDLEFAKVLWRFPGDPPPFSPNSKAYYDTQGENRSQIEGWAQIANLCSRWVWVALPNDGDKGVAYISTGPAARVAYPLADVHYYQIDGTHTFYQLVLASSPDAVVAAAEKETFNCIARAYSKLMWLNYTDTGFAALNELYSRANAEYYEGVNWTTQATLASGDEALLYLAKAATAFTRSQSHAKQVYYALVPPPTRPEDLGLRPYGGSWAEWEY
jgi:hypothetical protein